MLCVLQPSPTPSHIFLQSASMSHEAEWLTAASHQVISQAHWLDNSSCQSLSSAYLLPVDSALTPTPTCLSSATLGWNSYYGILNPSTSASPSDWVLPGSMSWGQGSVPGEVSNCLSELHLSAARQSVFHGFVGVSVQTSGSV